MSTHRNRFFRAFCWFMICLYTLIFAGVLAWMAHQITWKFAAALGALLWCTVGFYLAMRKLEGPRELYFGVPNQKGQPNAQQ